MKENFHLLQQENEQLRRQLGLHKGGGGGGGGGMQLGMPAHFGVGGGAGGGGGGRASRMGVLGMEDGMMWAPATVLAPRYAGRASSWPPFSAWCWAGLG